MRVKHYGPAVRLLAVCGLLMTALATAQEAPGDSKPANETPFSVEMDKQIADNRVFYQIMVEAQRRLDPDRTHVIAHIENSLGHSLIRSLKRITPQQWRLEFSPQRRARYRIDLEVSGLGLDGERFRHSLISQYIDFPEAGDPFIMPEDRKIAAINAELQAMKEGRASAAGGALSYTSADTTGEVEASSDQSRHFEFQGNLMLYIAVILANAVVIGLLGFGFWILKNNADMDERRAKFKKQAEESEAPSQPTMQDLSSSSGSSSASPTTQPASPEKMPMDDGSGAPGRYDEPPKMDAAGGLGGISGENDN